MITRDDIEAGKTEKGGYTKAQLAAWGIPWPPPTGWKDKLVRGEEFEHPPMSEIRPERTAHDLLREVVMAVVEAGHASDLWEYPDVLAHFGAQMPEDRSLLRPHVPTNPPTTTEARHHE